MGITAGVEIEFQVNGNKISGVRWGDKEGTPFFALHGWLDNSASFQFLAPLLEHSCLISLDLPGHGHSYHRTHLGAYNIWQDIAEIVVISNQLGWKKFGLMGHSRGAMVATLFAATFPEKISSLVLIEAVVPQSNDAEESPSQLASSIESIVQQSKRSRHYYRAFSDAVASRQRGFVPLGKEDATVLAERGVFEDENGFYWGNDYKLLSPSEVKFTSAQINAFLRCISMPVLLIAAQDGLIHEMCELQSLLSKIANITLVELDGNHHLHMSSKAVELAERINEFIVQG